LGKYKMVPDYDIEVTRVHAEWTYAGLDDCVQTLENIGLQSDPPLRAPGPR
jgi:hypothetical protein